MQYVNIKHLTKGPRDHQFDIVMRSPRSQVILGALAPGHCSSRQPSVNKESDQIIYAVEGDGLARIGRVDHQIHAGCLLMIPAGRPYQLTNTGSARLLFLDFFAPPAYGEAGGK